MKRGVYGKGREQHHQYERKELRYKGVEVVSGKRNKVHYRHTTAKQHSAERCVFGFKAYSDSDKNDARYISQDDARKRVYHVMIDGIFSAYGYTQHQHGYTYFVQQVGADKLFDRCF